MLATSAPPSEATYGPRYGQPAALRQGALSDMDRREFVRRLAILGLSLRTLQSTAHSSTDTADAIPTAGFLDFRSLDHGVAIDTDLCIVGAGAAGITLARAFADSNVRVCMIESGGLRPAAATQDLYRGTVVGLPYHALHASRLRYFGGSTNHWGGFCATLNEMDFKTRHWVPHSGWPISRADIEPYYWMAKDICQIGPYLGEEKIWRHLAEKPPPVTADTIGARFWQFKYPAPRFGEAYGRALEGSSNILVLLHANVVRITADALGRRVGKMQIRSIDGRAGSVSAKLFVLCCGGIENSRVLLVSNQIEPLGLGNRHGIVGRFFQEHPQVSCGELLAHDDGYLRRAFSKQQKGGIYYLAGFQPNENIQEQEEILNVCFSVGYQGVSQVAESGNGSQIARFSVVANLEQAPNPLSRVLLSDEKDALGLQRVRLDWRLTDLEKKTLRRALGALDRAFRHTGSGEVRLSDWLSDMSGALGPSMAGQYHHMGTTRMSDDAKKGVVDQDCRVHGIDNLYVAGSSVFPTVGYAGPTLTIIALALRLAAHLKQRFKKHLI